MHRQTNATTQEAQLSFDKRREYFWNYTFAGCKYLRKINYSPILNIDLAINKGNIFTHCNTIIYKPQR